VCQRDSLQTGPRPAVLTRRGCSRHSDSGCDRWLGTWLTTPTRRCWLRSCGPGGQRREILGERGDSRDAYDGPRGRRRPRRTGVGYPLLRQISRANFRWASNKRLRLAFTSFADNSGHERLWAADIYRRACQRYGSLGRGPDSCSRLGAGYLALLEHWHALRLCASQRRVGTPRCRRKQPEFAANG